MRIWNRPSLVAIYFFWSIFCISPSTFGQSNGDTSVHKKLEKKSTDKKKSAIKKALFAGGCFWCMEPPFDKKKGVLKTISGFAGGKKANPSYKDVSSGKTKHIETVLVEFDPKQVTFSELVEIYWRQVDPTDDQGQFVDRGLHYRPVIFYYDEGQKAVAVASKNKLAQLNMYGSKKIKTDILPATAFYPAEDYHQDYYIKNPIRYKYYRYRSGRDQFLKKYWKNNKKKESTKKSLGFS